MSAEPKSDWEHVAEHFAAILLDGWHLVRPGQAVTADGVLCDIEELSRHQTYASLASTPHSGEPYVKYVYGDYVHPNYDGPWQPEEWHVPLYRLTPVDGAS